MVIKQPDDKSHFILPDLGEGVHEAELIRWLIAPGDTVTEHQTLAEMETDKALVEVPSPWDGVIKELHGKEGEILNVGNPLVSYEIGGAAAPASPPAAVSAVVEEEESEDAGTVVGSVDASLSIPASFVQNEPAPVNAAAGKALATPAVRRIARDMSVDIDTVPGTGRGGRVTASDVHNHATGTTAAPSPAAAPAQTPAPVPAPAPDPAPSMHAQVGQHAPQQVPAPSAAPAMELATPVALPLEGVAERIPFRGVRRKIAQSLLHSVQTTVHFTVVDEVDVTELQKKRKGLEALLGRGLSLLPFLMTAVCTALKQHPILNANVDDFVEEIHVKNVINLGCAVDTEHGLMVPVIDNADQLTVVQLADRVTEVAKGCRDRSIARENLSGGTFTISNVGSYGGAFATPIINYPEVAILAAGRARERVLTRDGAFYAGWILPLSLSCDHRVVDGAEGARFLNTVKGLLESPGNLLPQL